jgi:hypothetical protein
MIIEIFIGPEPLRDRETWNCHEFKTSLEEGLYAATRTFPLGVLMASIDSCVAVLKRPIFPIRSWAGKTLDVVNPIRVTLQILLWVESNHKTIAT